MSNNVDTGTQTGVNANLVIGTALNVAVSSALRHAAQSAKPGPARVYRGLALVTDASTAAIVISRGLLLVFLNQDNKRLDLKWSAN